MNCSAGMLIFVHELALLRMASFIQQINGTSRVSPEVLSLHMVKPTRADTKALAGELRTRPELQHLERIHRLRPNNAVRDLTAEWRLDKTFVDEHQLVLNLETVNPDFRKKYPDPNLTLPAGGVEQGEMPYMAAHRELFEETRIRVHDDCVGPPIGLFRGGMKMFTVVVTRTTPLVMHDGVLYIGWREEPSNQSQPCQPSDIIQQTHPIPHFFYHSWQNIQTLRACDAKHWNSEFATHGEQRSTTVFSHPTQLPA